MDKHYITISAYQAKNKAHEEAHEFVFSYNHCLIDDKKVAELKDLISAKIDDINKKYPRCKPIEITFRGYNKQYQVEHWESIYAETFSMTIHKIKRIELSEAVQPKDN